MTILEQFTQNQSDYNEFCEKLTNLIQSILTSEEIKPHQITKRVKGFDSLKRKVENKQGKYSTLSDITDIIGIRIITYFEDEVDLVANILQREFTIDYVNSVDKRNSEPDKFGYKSLHKVLGLSESRNTLAEYKKYDQLKAEIQIRSILQHSWAEIEHDLGYKSNSVIPDIAKRSFYRISALLEVADIEFVNLKNLLTSYKEKVKNQISKIPGQFNLDQDTLIEFVSSNSLFKELEQKLMDVTNLSVTGGYGDLSIPIETFERYGINTIEDLVNGLAKYSKLIIRLEETSSFEYSGLGKANCIHSLAEILQIENDDRSFFEGGYGDRYTFEEAKKDWI